MSSGWHIYTHIQIRGFFQIPSQTVQDCYIQEPAPQYNFLSVCLSVCIFAISFQMLWPAGLKCSGGNGVSHSEVVYSEFGEDRSKYPPMGMKKKAKNGILAGKNHGLTGLKLGCIHNLTLGIT